MRISESMLRKIIREEVENMNEMDPTADMRGVHTKIGIDATYKPERRDYGERIRYPEMDLKKYL